MGLYVAPVSIKLVEREKAYNIDEYCSNYASNTLNCQEIEIDPQQKSFLGDFFECETCGGPPGGAVGLCHFQRLFATTINSDKYPILEISKVWCQEEYLYCGCAKEPRICMEREYERCKEKHKSELEIFNRFVNTVQIW